MSTVYKLLRNNRESGPFTIGELLQQQPQPADMLWIEGRSTAWTRLADMELTPQDAAPAPPEAVPSFTPDEIEGKAVALRERALAYQPAASFRPSFPNAAHLSLQAPEEGIDFVDHRKEKSRALSDTLMTLLVVALFGGGLYASRSMFQRSEEVAGSPAVIRITSTESNAAKPIAAIPQQTPVTDTARLETAPPPSRRKPAAPLPGNSASAVAEAPKGEPMTSVSTGEKQKAEAPLSTQAAVEAPPKAEAETASKEAVSESDGKKKGLGQAIKNIFRKKKKGDEGKKSED